MLVVVRHVWERSLPLCLQALEREGVKPILVNETPFVRAVERTFEHGMNHRSEDILLAIDADVVLEEGAVKLISQCAEKRMAADDLLSRIDFRVKDKFRGHVYAGCHLYVNSYSSLFYKHFAGLPDTTTHRRPESYNCAFVRRTMGLSSKDEKSVVGTHDFDQYYAHIFAKYFNRAVRDNKKLTDMQHSMQIKLGVNPDDHDFKVALAGLEAGAKIGIAETNADKYPSAEATMLALGIREKEPIA